MYEFLFSEYRIATDFYMVIMKTFKPGLTVLVITITCDKQTK